MTNAMITSHAWLDWCHLCGERTRDLADVHYSTNAENRPDDRSNYVRICADCAETILEKAQQTDRSR